MRLGGNGRNFTAKTTTFRLAPDVNACLEILRSKFSTRDQAARLGNGELVQAITQFVRVLQKHPSNAAPGTKDPRFVAFQSSVVPHALSSLTCREALQLLLALQTGSQQGWINENWCISTSEALLELFLEPFAEKKRNVSRFGGKKNDSSSFCNMHPGQTAQFLWQYYQIKGRLKNECSLTKRLQCLVMAQVPKLPDTRNRQFVYIRTHVLLSCRCLIRSGYSSLTF